MKLKTAKTFFVFLLWLLAPFCAMAQEYSVSYKEADIEQVISDLRKKTGYDFVYQKQIVANVSPITCTYRGVTLIQLLDRIFYDKAGLDYEIVDKSVILSQQSKNGKITKTVTGIVTDDTGEALIGAIVLQEGTKTWAGTDADGNFKITVEGEDPVLKITYTGMNDYTIRVRSQKDPFFLVNMETNTTLLEEVVVTGYGNMSKANYTGSATLVKADDIIMAGVSSIDQMLSGVVPGMLVQQESGMVGASPKIRVRGTSSLLGSQDPVWVVDGVVQRNPQPFNSENNTNFSVDVDDISQLAGNAISWLNPNDIESITVLKDASATAIYGSEAANGVIVITTKKANVGKVSVSYSGDFSVGQRPHYGMYNQMNSQELMEFSKQMYEDRVSYPSSILPIGYAGLLQSYLNKEITKEQFDAEYVKMANQNTDWFDELFRTSFSHKHSLSIAGGSDKIQNRTSFGYNSETGESYGNNSTLLTATSNTTINLAKNKLTVNLLLNGSWRQTEGYAYGVDPFNYAYNTARTIPMYNEDGTLYYHEKWANESSTVINGKKSYLYNIKNEMDNTGSMNNTRTFGMTGDVKWQILPELQYQGLVSYSSSSSDSKQHATERSFYASVLRGYDYGAYESSAPEFGYTRLPFGGLLKTGLTNVSTVTVRNALVFDKTFNEKHRLTAQLGIETNSSKITGNTMERYGYMRDRGETFVDLPVTYYDPSMDEYYDNPFVRGTATVLNKINNKLSEYATAVYSYDNRYVLNLSARVDAANRFGQDKNKRFEPTWSIGAKWRIASEEFAKNWRWLSNLDLIASFGSQGNTVETVSPYLIAYNSGVNEYYNNYILNIKSLPYPDLGWEKTNTFNLGVDAALLDGRLNFTFNYFKKVSDVLSSRNIPRENGVENAIVDGGEMTNTGYDFVINVVPVRTKDFTWQFSLNTAVAENAVNKNQRINTLTDYLEGSAVVNGEAFSTFYSYQFTGLDPETGKPTFANMDVENGETPLAYLVKSGKFTPDFSGGLSMMFKYRNWQLYTLFNIQWGGHSRLPLLYDTDNNYGIPTPEMNVSRDLADRWRNPGDQTDIPSIPSSSDYIELPVTSTVASTEQYLHQMYNYSDARVARTDFIRCGSLSLSYEFGRSALSKLGVQRLLLKGSMTNPFVWAFDDKWNGIDPETGNWPARRITSLSVQIMF